MRTAGELHDALVQVCEACGLDPAGAQLLRNVNNAVFRLPAHPAVVRLVTLPSYAARAERAVRAAAWYAEHGIPAVRLLPGLRQPVRVDGLVATVWQEVPTGGRRPTGSDLARVLRAVHAMPVGSHRSAGLPAWNPVDDFRARLADATELPAADRTFLARRADELESALAGLEFVLPRAMLHGDAHLGNLIAAPGGPVVCDFDSCCIGPPEWDLVPMVVSTVRFGGSPAQQADLAAVYGMDITGWSGFEVLRGIRDLKIVAGVFPGPGRSDRVAAELRRRLASLRAGRVSDRWTRVH